MAQNKTSAFTVTSNGYCEDYPCCGHTDGLGCNYTTPVEYLCSYCNYYPDDDVWHTVGDVCATARQIEKEEREEEMRDEDED